MRNTVDQLKDLSLERSAARSERVEIADIWLQSGLPEGFSMEGVFDRSQQKPLRNEGWA